MLKLDLTRREFPDDRWSRCRLLTIPTSGHTAVTPCKMIRMQVGAVSFVDEASERVLDVLQQRA
jgi:hypothetical protein